MSKTAILIDDDQDDLDFMKDALENIDRSLHCLMFTNPNEAIRVISDELLVRPDFVFTDINMPGMTGDKCVSELRKRKDLTT
jgi:CheY-like chemotaxis protein